MYIVYTVPKVAHFVNANELFLIFLLLILPDRKMFMNGFECSKPIGIFTKVLNLLLNIIIIINKCFYLTKKIDIERKPTEEWFTSI